MDVERGAGIGGVRFALIPEHAFERVRNERGDLAVEQLTIRAFAFTDLSGVARGAGHLRALRKCLGFRGLEFLEFDVVVGFRLFRVDLGQGGALGFQSGAKFGLGLLDFRGDPRLDRGAADGRVDQADRDADLAVDLTAEEVERRAEGADVVWRASQPFALGLSLCRGRTRRLFLEVTDERKSRGGLLLLEVLSAIDRHGHVGLAGAKPDVADQHVGDLRLPAVLARGREPAALRAGRERVEAERPLAGRIGFGGLLLAGEFDGYFLVGIRPAPDRHGLVALEDHMVREEGWQFQIGCGEDLAGGQAEQGEQGRAKRGHAYLTTPKGRSCDKTARRVTLMSGYRGPASRLGRR